MAGRLLFSQGDDATHPIDGVVKSPFLMSVRRLAAIDMYGTKGRLLRRRLVVMEFVGAVLVCLFLFLLLVLKGHSVALTIIGIWIALIGANYVPLAIHAIDFSWGSRLLEELQSVDIRQELRYYSVAQFWVLVPLLFVLLALRETLARR
jgi:hypothetical protein